MNIKEAYRYSNHDKHFKGGIITAFALSIVFTAGCAFGMEYKDKMSGGKFDWSDILWTMMGGIIGETAQLAVIYLVLQFI